MRRLVSVALLLVAMVGPLSAQDGCGSAEGWTAWDFYIENDSFVPGRRGSDARYTNGVRFSLTDGSCWRATDWVEGRLFSPIMRGQSFQTANSFVFGQNFFTPNLITTYYEDARSALCRDVFCRCAF